MTRNRLLLGGMILILCCVAGGAAVYLPARLVPAISEQLPENYSHLYVQIASPLRESRWPLNSFVPILVQAQAAEPIQRVEVFINGKVLQPQTGIGNSFSHIWMWQPGVAGDFVVTARATGKSGLTGVSAPLLIHATAAGHTVSPVAVQEGETLQDIAAENNIPLEQMQESNPNLGPNDPLQAGSHVVVPNPAAPVTNEDIIEPLPDSGSQPDSGGASGGNEPPGGPPSNGPQFVGPSMNFWNNLNFLLQTNSPAGSGGASSPKYPPAKPSLLGDFKGCDISLRFIKTPFEDMDPKSGWMGWEEAGFFVYRSRDGGPSQRIATLPPVGRTAGSNLNVEFADTGQYGTLTYYVSAFNALGEVASDPLTFALNPGVCPPSGADAENGIRMDPDGNIILPFQMDMAYLYVQINGSGAVRVPEGSRMFLPGSGMRFNLYNYLSTLSSSVQAPDLTLHMEVWGWQAGNLVFAGTFDTEIHRTVLSICSVEGEGACSNGNGSWAGSVNLSHDKPLQDQVYEMRWQVTSLTAAEDLQLWLAQQPITFTQQYQSGLIYVGHLSWWVVNGKYLNPKGNEGVFSLRLGDMLYPNPPPKEIGWDNTPSHHGEYRTDGFIEQPVGQPFSLYAQVSPQLAAQGYQHASNTVTLLYDTSALPPADMPPLISQYPSMYTVEILRDQFKQASHSVDEQWGCVIIDEDPTGQFAVGQTVCPPVPTSGYEWFPGEDPCGGLISWLENCLLGGIEAAYTAVKDTLAAGVVAIIPGCGDSTDCQDIIRKGIDYGATYVTGIPPDLPNVEDLVSGEISSEIVDLATGGLASATGLDESVLGDFCENVVDCQGKLSEPIKAQLQQARSQASQPACRSAIEAYHHNVQAFCLDPSIVVHPAPGAMDSPAVALVRVTRKNTPEAQAVNEADKDKYRLFVTVSADPPPGSTMNPKDPFWKPAQVSIPWLEPGESVVVPATLEHIPYQDLDKNFTNGIGHMKAVETCYSSNSSWDWVPCQSGGSDSWDFTILWNSALQGALVQP